MLTALAPAKLNLSLHITGKRADGYHVLDSLVAFTAFGDRVTVEAADSLSLTVDGPLAAGVPDGPGNLAWRAAEALARYARREPGARISIDKHIPSGAGLGGGSSDAATTVRLLCALWGVVLPATQARTLLLPLGADLPVCWQGKPARMQGVGENVTPLAQPLPAWPVLLVKPRASLATGDIYALYRHEERTHAALPESGLSIAALARLRNDLQRPAIAHCAEVGQVLLELQTQIGCGLARMSGSGSACFGLFDDADSCARAADRLRHAHPDWWIMATTLQAAS